MSVRLAAAGERAVCGHIADVVLTVAGRRFPVEFEVADMALAALATAVPLTYLCPGSRGRVGAVRWDPASGPLFPGGNSWGAVSLRDDRTGIGVLLVGAPGLLTWPTEHTDVVTAAWRVPPGWDLRGLPDLTGRTNRRLDPDVSVDDLSGLTGMPAVRRRSR